MLTQILIVFFLQTLIQSHKRSVIRHTRMERATRDSATTTQDREREHHLDTHLTTIPYTDLITIVYADTTPDQTAHTRTETMA